MRNQLFNIIEPRKAAMPEGSCTAHLLAKGDEEILSKFGEECAEVILAANCQGNQRLVEELADLVYHFFQGLVLGSREFEQAYGISAAIALA